MKQELTSDEIEEIIKDIDKQLFKLLFPIFDSMSRRGKVVALDTLSVILDLEKEE